MSSGCVYTHPLLGDYYIHIGVGSDVVCSYSNGNPEPQMVERTADVSTLFYVLLSGFWQT